MFTYPIISSVSPGGAVDLLTGLVAWWTLDETSGNRVDSHNSLSLAPVGIVGSATGKQSNCVDLTNPGYLINTSAPSMTASSAGYSLACWVNFDVLVGSATVFANSNSLSTVGYTLFQRVDGADIRLGFVVTDSVGAIDYEVQSDEVLSTGTWYFVYVQYDGVTDKIGMSVNGGSLKEVAADGAYTVSDDFAIGARSGVGFYMDGKVDEVARWDRILNASEISALYNSGSGITYSNL